MRRMVRGAERVPNEREAPTVRVALDSRFAEEFRPEKKFKTFLRSDCYSFLLFLKDIPSVYENCFYATVKFFAVKRSGFSFAAEKF